MTPAWTSRGFDLALPPFTLESGATLPHLLVRGWWAGPSSDLPALAGRVDRLLPECADTEPLRVVRRDLAEQRALAAPARRPGGAGLDPRVPTVLLVHALTGDARAGGPRGWWGPLIGPGRALDPRTCRVLCFNQLGSCYGTTGPADEGFPRRTDDERLPATVTTWDQARTLALALDALGIDRLHLVAGGSLGGMIALALAALAPTRCERVAVLAGSVAATPWLVGWNHVGRQAVLLDPGFPEDPARGLALARQVAHLTYRSAPGLAARQPVPTYLDHQGRKLADRFDGRAYLAQLDAMDRHDLGRVPPPLQEGTVWPAADEVSGDPRLPWGLRRLRASVLAVGIDSDVLFPPEAMTQLARDLAGRGLVAASARIESPHGHDAFLIEWDQVDRILGQALVLPVSCAAQAEHPKENER